MNILGNRGFADATSASATYSRNMGNEFVTDANTLGYSVNMVNSGHIQALNAKNQIEGEWTATDGGMLAWSV